MLSFKQFLTEVKYAHTYTDAGKVYERYMALFKREQKRQYGQLTLLDYDFSEDSGGSDYAIIYLWATNMTEEQAKHDAIEFAREFNLPYTDVSTDVSTSSSVNKVHSRIHVTIFFQEQLTP